jgi:nitric-oxide synthase
MKKDGSMTTYTTAHSANKSEQEDQYWAPDNTDHRPQELFMKAQTYQQLFHHEKRDMGSLTGRIAEIQSEIRCTGTYKHTYDELQFGTKAAWRNSPRCTGRLHWGTLHVRDMRHLTTAEGVFEALVEHIQLATNGGRIRSVISVFAPQTPGQPGVRIWNPQLIRYAGYQQTDGTVIGDPSQVEFTNELFKLGWEGGERTPFDLLPLVIQMPYEKPKLFELPPEIVMEVPIHHPNYDWFADLGLKWHAVPIVSNMLLEIGGISYPAAPFNGWYLETEIGARNLADQNRYNMLPVIAEKLGLDRRSDRTLWKDRALVELNIAVLNSFAQHGVTMVDHHTVARQLIVHEEQEKHAGRCMYADWGWVVPPMSGSTTPVFHRPYENKVLTPNFFYQVEAWKAITPKKVEALSLCPYSSLLAASASIPNRS